MDIFKIAKKIIAQHQPKSIGEIIALSVTNNDEALVEYDTMCDSLNFNDQNVLRHVIDNVLRKTSYVAIDTELTGKNFDVYELSNFMVVTNVNSNRVIQNVNSKTLNMIFEDGGRDFMEAVRSMEDDDTIPYGVDPYEYVEREYLVTMTVNGSERYVSTNHYKLTKNVPWQQVALLF